MEEEKLNELMQKIYNKFQQDFTEAEANHYAEENQIRIRNGNQKHETINVPRGRISKSGHTSNILKVT